MAYTYGLNIKLDISGTSHGEYMEARLSGFPKGSIVDTDALYAFMLRRAPGKDRFSTKRSESDRPVFLSGLDGQITNGDDIVIRIYNENKRPSDYDFKDTPRPSHADYTAVMKYGKDVDISGGGHFSGRLTAPLCAVGGICLQYLSSLGIGVVSHIYKIGNVTDTPFDALGVGKRQSDLLSEKSFRTLSEGAAERMQALIDSARERCDSIGGTVECAVYGLPVGLGEHMFASCEARISGAVFAIPAVKGIEFGSGFSSSEMLGSENNDPFVVKDGKIAFKSNNAGGILGGMSSGAPIIFRAAVKPTPSIGIEQDTVSLSRLENVKIRVGGRHDPCIVQRSLPAFEAAAAIAVTDMLLDGSEVDCGK